MQRGPAIDVNADHSGEMSLLPTTRLARASLRVDFASASPGTVDRNIYLGIIGGSDNV